MRDLQPRFNGLGEKGSWLAWLAMSLLGVGLVFFRIGHHSLWSDEAVSIAVTNISFSDFLHLSRYESHPPLYYFSIKTFAAIFGHCRAVLRSFSALGLLAAALLIG